ncbi:MAG: MmcQ/YjbR family DNA-binding protein [Verrucomicrobia bacterium]|nr:MmcQ/YjbR family DNA-binding protein [Verrucomicrobiota bacterium]
MSPADFRRIALEMPGATEATHMQHADFRVGGRIFATLGYPDERFAVVLLTPDDQAAFVAAAPNVFSPVAGGWGRRGSTQVTLACADTRNARKAITAAWQRRAPKLR